jgi:uncharacterized protein (DUF169 family)
MPSPAWTAAAADLSNLLHLTNPPLAITWSTATEASAAGISPFDEPMAPPTGDGRTGRVPAGCVFWMKGTDRTFSTEAADHGNCSVGSVTHGFKGWADVVANADVAALLESGWVTMDDVPNIPVVADGAERITYGPLAESPLDPDVVLLRLNAKQLMVLHDAVPTMAMEGKPQCHIVALAKGGTVAASVGCMLSRVRTQMPSTEMTAAIPAARVASVVDALRATERADSAVAAYAADDASRFAPA